MVFIALYVVHNVPRLGQISRYQIETGLYDEVYEADLTLCDVGCASVHKLADV